jgi:hypothetical protein
VVWCEGYSHHAEVCEVEEGEEGDEKEPQEFGCCPFKAHHGIHRNCIIDSLSKHVWNFHDHLHINYSKHYILFPKRLNRVVVIHP